MCIRDSPGYVYAQKDGEIYVNLYIAGEGTVTLDDNEIRLSQTTRYPWEGKVRIEVNGTQAQLFVHGADQPVLIVNDLKRGDVSGQVGLWLHSSTLAHFRNVRIRPEN